MNEIEIEKAIEDEKSLFAKHEIGEFCLLYFPWPSFRTGAEEKEESHIILLSPSVVKEGKFLLGRTVRSIAIDRFLTPFKKSTYSKSIPPHLYGALSELTLNAGILPKN